MVDADISEMKREQSNSRAEAKVITHSSISLM